MKHKLPGAIVVCACLSLSSMGWAQSSSDDFEGGVSQVSITISPIYLALPLLEVTGEYQLTPQMGAALIAGLGSVEDKDITYSLWEVGASFRYYAVGDFDHGMQLGAEVKYLGASMDESEANVDVSAVGAGTSIGPFIGYKFVADMGLTVDIQAGFKWLAVSAQAEVKSDDASATASESDSAGVALLNLNLGWSF